MAIKTLQDPPKTQQVYKLKINKEIYNKINSKITQYSAARLVWYKQNLDFLSTTHKDPFSNTMAQYQMTVWI